MTIPVEKEESGYIDNYLTSYGIPFAKSSSPVVDPTY